MKKTICFIFLAIVFITTRQISAQTAAPEETANPANVVFRKRTALPFKQKLTGEQKKRLSPEAKDLAAYTSFLRQPKTGLIKLFPDLGCQDNAEIIRADASCRNFIPNSAFYSFREKDYTTEYLADIRLENGFFVSDGALSQGILVALGKIPLEDATLGSAGMDFLINYRPEQNNKDVFRQAIQITKGVKSGNFLYKKVLPVVSDMTYALRVIAYRGRFYRTFRGAKFDVLLGDERTDVILAFRVVGKAEDGSATLLWKELERKKPPKVIFQKASKE